MRDNPALLPHRNTASCFTSISGHNQLISELHTPRNFVFPAGPAKANRFDKRAKLRPKAKGA
jgi:hypothetical protein